MDEERWVGIIRENLSAKRHREIPALPSEERIYVPGLFALSRSIAEQHGLLAEYERVRDERKPPKPEGHECPVCGQWVDAPDAPPTEAELDLHAKLDRLWAANPDLFGAK
jgi:hypothetical protein